MIVALLEHPPERHMRRIAMPRHIERRHTERISLNLEGALPAKKRLTRQSVNLADLLVRHGVAAARRAIAVDHEKVAGASVRPVVGVRKARIDRKVIAGIGIHQARGDAIEAFRRLPVALLDLWPEFA